MKTLCKVLAVGTVLVSLAASAAARPPADAASPKLEALAARADKRAAWPPLRRYASSQSNRQERGLAHFVLGYREYEAGEYSLAAEDLTRARETQFSLADFAEYFGAAAASKARQPRRAAEELDGFRLRHPESPWRLEALALLARALIDQNEPERAIEALEAEPRVRQRPDLALLLARAYGKAQRLTEAARAFQEIYYAHPTASEADEAAETLRQLEAQLGPGFPSVADETRTARLEALFKSERFAEALKEYHALLQTRPASALAGRWKLGRTKCLLHLKKTGEAIEELRATVFIDPTLDAERWATLVDAYAQARDEAAMLGALEPLGARYPESPSYASALFTAGSYFARQGDWKAAVRYYQPMADNFPQHERSQDAHWRVAWSYYLEKDFGQARPAFMDHVKRYPKSPHLPAALYWLGRIKEQDGAVPEARAVYELLKARYVHTYYARVAGQRLEAASSRRAPGPALGESLSQSAPDVAEGIPRSEPAPVLCEPSEPHEALRASRVLKGLGLVSLAKQYLRAALSDSPSTPYVLLALSQLEAEEGNYSAALSHARKLAPNSVEYDFSELPKQVWDLLYPRPYWKLVERQARAYRLDPYLVMGLIRQESAFNPQARSRANARGLMQLLPQTASPSRRGRAAAARKLYDPAYNVRLGCRYLRRVLDAFGGNIEPTLAAYNAGDLRVKDWLAQHPFREPPEFVETIPFRDTRAYVEGVLRDTAIYRELMTGAQKFRKCG